MSDIRERRQKQFMEFLQSCPECNAAEIVPLSGDASFRRYFRAQQDGKHYVVMDAPPQKEDVRKYLVVAEYLRKHGYSTPDILASDIGHGFLLLEDLGDDLFSTWLQKQEESVRQQKEQELYESAIDVLISWHNTKNTLVNEDQLQLRKYDERLLMDEVELFSQWYLPQVLGQEKASELEEEYLGIWRSILQSTRFLYDHLVHRDYHADNLMWLPEREGLGRVGLLDFQDAVYGDPAYDVVSLLEDARRDVPLELVQHCMLGFLYATKVNKDHFTTAYAVLGAQRNCKIIGIFVRLAVRDHKPQYLSLLSRVWRHLERDLNNSELTPLREWLNRHIPTEFRGEIRLKKDEDE